MAHGTHCTFCGVEWSSLPPEANSFIHYHGQCLELKWNKGDEEFLRSIKVAALDSEDKIRKERGW